MLDFKKRHPVLVPYWIIKQLQRNCLPFNTVLNLSEMCKVCSQEDLVLMLELNRNTFPIFGTNYDLTTAKRGLTSYWAGYSLKDYSKLQELQPLYEGRLEARLFGPEAVAEGTNSTAVDSFKGKAFDIYPVESSTDASGVILLIIHPGYFGGANAAKIQKQLVREYLKQSYVFCDYHMLAADPIFCKYVNDLQETSTVL